MSLLHSFCDNTSCYIWWPLLERTTNAFIQPFSHDQEKKITSLMMLSLSNSAPLKTHPFQCFQMFQVTAAQMTLHHSLYQIVTIKIMLYQILNRCLWQNRWGPYPIKAFPPYLASPFASKKNMSHSFIMLLTKGAQISLGCIVLTMVILYDMCECLERTHDADGHVA